MSAGLKRWKPYPAYKDSGVVWLGQVPEGWGIKRLGVTTQFIQTGPFGSQLHSEDYIENGTPVINPSHIQNGKIVPNYQCSIDKYNEVRLQRHKLTLGDVVFARRGEMGRCAEILSGDDGYICGTGCLQIRFKDNALSAFFASYLQTEFIRDYLKLESVGSTMDNLNTEILSKIPIPVPPLPEQQAITAFLDQQCAQIDSLIEKKQRMLGLLDEKRCAVITQAVTRGLDPTVPLKDSGVEWLGMVPKGWEVNSMQQVCSEFKAGPFGSSLTKEMYSASGYRVYGQEQVIPNDFSIGHCCPAKG